MFNEAARASVAFDIARLPMSVNNQLISDKRAGREGVKFLDPRIREWRAFVRDAMHAQRIEWKPRGVVAGVLIFESPIWVTKKKTARKADADNRVKASFDAIALGTSPTGKADASTWDDSTLWEGHFYKLFARRERTRVWLFDIGDVVDGAREVDDPFAPA